MAATLLCSLAALGGVLAFGRGEPVAPAPVAQAREGLFAGVVVARQHAVVDPGDGTRLVLTGLTLDGTPLASLAGDAPPEPAHTLQLWFPGGVVSEDLGSFVADAPARHETREGRWLVVRHRPSAELGRLENGEVLAGEVLVGGCIGLHTAFVSREGRFIVQGRPGTRLTRNVPGSEARNLLH